VNRLPGFLSCTSLGGLSANKQAWKRLICLTVLQSVTQQKDRHPVTGCPALMAFGASRYLWMNFNHPTGYLLHLQQPHLSLNKKCCPC
jgi:hypothetical protein